MTQQRQQILTQFIAGIFGGTILGIFGWLAMTSYGGNHGCFEIIDLIFNDAGYSSCGSFGLCGGLFFGPLLSILFIKIKKIYSYKISLYLLTGAFLLPIIYAYWTFARLDDYSAFYLGIQIIVLTILISTVPSAIVTFLINLPLIINRKK